MRELGYSVSLVNHVDSQAANAWSAKRGFERAKHIMLKRTPVQDIVEKRHTDLRYITQI